MYGDNESKVVDSPSYTALFRDVIKIKMNVVTMLMPPPRRDGVRNGNEPPPEKTKEFDVTDKVNIHENIDRGPPGSPHVLEIHLTDRIFTLYTDSKDQQN